MHLTAFGRKLDKEQARIDRLGVVISDDDELQFYMEQIYSSNCFDKKEMVDWENKPINIKDDYNEAKLYFEGLVRDLETYTQNSGGGSGKMGYESANQMADVGDEIRKYIHEIASAAVASNELQRRIQDKGHPISSDVSPNPGANQHSCNSNVSTRNIGKERWRRQRRRRSRAHVQIHAKHGGILLNAWLSSRRRKHTSATCSNKREGHNDLATTARRFGGSTYWPGRTKVKPSQQDHVSYKGKLATN
jgi:hypothetical protein